MTNRRGARAESCTRSDPDTNGTVVLTNTGVVEMAGNAPAVAACGAAMRPSAHPHGGPAGSRARSSTLPRSNASSRTSPFGTRRVGSSPPIVRLPVDPPGNAPGLRRCERRMQPSAQARTGPRNRTASTWDLETQRQPSPVRHQRPRRESNPPRAVDSGAASPDAYGAIRLLARSRTERSRLGNASRDPPGRADGVTRIVGAPGLAPGSLRVKAVPLLLELRSLLGLWTALLLHVRCGVAYGDRTRR